MELTKSSSSTRSSIKFNLPCQEMVAPTTERWLTITQLLSYTNGDTAILKGLLLQPRKEVVVKFGREDAILKEYKACEALYLAKLPNFLKYICHFVCDDSFEEILQQNTRARPFLCRDVANTSPEKGKTIGFIVMPYSQTGSLGSFPWKKNQLPLFVNVLTQVVLASCYAFFATGFVHSDFHANNVLLRPTKKASISYGVIQQPIQGMYAMIMDFENPVKGDPLRFEKSIERIIYTACVADASDMMIDVNITRLRAWLQKTREWTEETAKELLVCMENMFVLRYVKSERPAMSFPF